ncbi:MAG: hypothetical protein KF686_03135 [Ramlibacter sp.]|nr:hypothetical protein [Ramlibacter sp.]
MAMRLFRRVALLPPLIFLGVLTGCAQIQLGAPVPGIDNIQKARSAGIAPVSLGIFSLAPGKPAGMDQSVIARTNRIFSPYDSSFAKYLKENLAADLRAAGLLDAASAVVIEGQLTESELDAAIGVGTGSVAARITVTRSGAKVYDRELRVSGSWESSFVGAYAVSAAVNEYSLLYRKLVSALLDDPAFRRAAKR